MNLDTEHGRIIGALAGIGAMVVGVETTNLTDPMQFANEVEAAVTRFKATFTPDVTRAALIALVQEAVSAGGPNPLRN